MADQLSSEEMTEFTEVLHAIQDDEQVVESLLVILNQPEDVRVTILTKVADSARADNAPQAFVNFLNHLFNEELAILVRNHLSPKAVAAD